LVLVLIRRRSQLKTLAWVLFFVGLFEALYGMMAFVDFNFQISANMAYFFVLLAIGVKVSTFEQKKRNPA